jgi:hypothetical protein
MTTMADPVTYHEWRVNRVRDALAKISTACGKRRMTRTETLALADALRDVARDVADLYYCPICGHPEVCTCSTCPVGSLTAPIEYA